MKAIVTVVGKDKVGIIAQVAGKLSRLNVNILDIRQTTMQDYFTMMMLVDTTACNVDFAALQSHLKPWERNKRGYPPSACGYFQFHAPHIKAAGGFYEKHRPRSYACFKPEAFGQTHSERAPCPKGIVAMLDIFEITETLSMIDKQHLDIRTITMGISLLDCADSSVEACCRKI